MVATPMKMVRTNEIDTSILTLLLATALEHPEEQKYTSFKKDTMSNKKNAEDKYKTEVVRIEDDEFVSVEYK